MDKIILIISIVVGLLLIVVAVLLLRLWQYKKQMRMFQQRILQRQEMDMNQPVTVEFFSRDVVALANALNEYTNMLKEKTFELEQSKVQLQMVIAGISHDFRTPLTAIKGYLQLIEKSERLDDRTAEYLSIAAAKTNYLKTLSDLFFEVAMLDEQTEKPELKPFNVTRLLSEEVMGQYEWIHDKEIEMEVRIPERDIILNSNLDYMTRIIENLFSNAKKYTRSKLQVTLEVWENEASTDANFDYKSKENSTSKTVCLNVCNDMIEGTQVDINQIFDAFYRDSSRHCEGAGLGLYIVKRLCDKLEYEVSAKIEGDLFEIRIQCEACS